jgi:hypothetical protein
MLRLHARAAAGRSHRLAKSHSPSTDHAGVRTEEIGTGRWNVRSWRNSGLMRYCRILSLANRKRWASPSPLRGVRVCFGYQSRWREIFLDKSALGAVEDAIRGSRLGTELTPFNLNVLMTRYLSRALPIPLNF